MPAPNHVFLPVLLIISVASHFCSFLLVSSRCLRRCGAFVAPNATATMPLPHPATFPTAASTQQHSTCVPHRHCHCRVDPSPCAGKSYLPFFFFSLTSAFFFFAGLASLATLMFVFLAASSCSITHSFSRHTPAWQPLLPSPLLPCKPRLCCMRTSSCHTALILAAIDPPALPALATTHGHIMRPFCA